MIEERLWDFGSTVGNCAGRGGVILLECGDWGLGIGILRPGREERIRKGGREVWGLGG